MLSTKIVDNLQRLERMEPEWAALLERSATNEPTLSPLWMLGWWQVFGLLDGRELRVAAFHHGGRLVGLAPLLHRRYRWGPFVIRRLELLASGEEEADEICSDYIGVLAERGWERHVALELARLLDAGGLGSWDEMVLPAMSDESVMVSHLQTALDRLGVVRLTDAGASPFIPLSNRSWDDYLTAQSSSHRYQIRRRLRDFDRWSGGEASLEVAATPADLDRGFKILQELHEARWRAEGKRGAFASSRFRAFHRRVLPELLARDALDLCWLSARGKPVAALYNIVWNGKVHYYQGGRVPDLPRGITPGLVIHTHAIRRAIERGCREYDFLPGNTQMKRLFARETHPVRTLLLVRPSLATRLRSVVNTGKELGRAARDLWSDRQGRFEIQGPAREKPR